MRAWIHRIPLRAGTSPPTVSPDAPAVENDLPDPARSGPDQRQQAGVEDVGVVVVAAARRLFAENGFFQTKVEQIAKLSRVSPATVYAQCGGKQGLLRSLMDS
jgi:AcrR family transcriptional regulator